MRAQTIESERRERGKELSGKEKVEEGRRKG
jgi:hypothetical protein